MLNKKVMIVSLGCDKNLVDTEKMLGILADEGCTFTDDLSLIHISEPTRH